MRRRRRRVGEAVGVPCILHTAGVLGYGEKMNVTRSGQLNQNNGQRQLHLREGFRYTRESCVQIMSYVCAVAVLHTYYYYYYYDYFNTTAATSTTDSKCLQYIM